jgi:hypothetical protein
MLESNKFAVRRHGKKISNGASVFSDRAVRRRGKFRIFLLRGFRCDDRFIQAAFAAVGHIAVDDTALGCLIESRGEAVEFSLGGCGVTAGDDRAELLLT